MTPCNTFIASAWTESASTFALDGPAAEGAARRWDMPSITPKGNESPS